MNEPDPLTVPELLGNVLAALAFLVGVLALWGLGPR